MRTIIILLALVAASFTAAAGKPSDHHFFVSFTYVDACGILRVGSMGWSGAKAYPKTSDLILRAADATGSNHKSIHITGISAICADDYNNLFNGK
jgi:hypothetical protein